MVKRFVAFILVLYLPLIGAETTWNDLQTVRSGEKIWVHYMDGKKLRKSSGTMGAWAADGLTVRLKKGEVVLSRDDVRKVAVYGGKSRRKGARNGFLAGLGVGAGIYIPVAAAGDVDTNLAAFAVLGTLFIGGVGALIGVAVGGTEKVPLYVAPAADSNAEAAASADTASTDTAQ